MPRVIHSDPPAFAGIEHLADELAAELRIGRTHGQPIFDEQRFSRTNLVRVTVLWDKWDGVSDEDRVASILNAYEQAEGREFRDRVALAVGVTLPEAHHSGLAPYRVEPLLRKDDKVSPRDCAQAMIAEGASTLAGGPLPLLCFPDENQAEACRRRLIERLPASEPVWAILQDAARVNGSRQ